MRRRPHAALQYDGEVERLLRCEEEEVVYTIVLKRRRPHTG